MNFTKRLGFLACSALVFTSILQAVPLGLDLTAGIGQRRDRVFCTNKFFTPVLFEIDDFDTSMSLYEATVKGDWFMDEWILRFDVGYGWNGDGRYKETFTVPNVATEKFTCHIDHATAFDFSIGEGYLFPIDDYYFVGPVAGWAYHQQKFRTIEALSDGVPIPFITGIKYNDRWSGPWLGIDAIFCSDEITVHIGYQYCWADWHAKWQLEGPDIFGVIFSDRRKSTNAHGNTLFLNGRYYPFCPEWSIGLGLKYEVWKAINGTVKPLHGSFDDVGFSSIQEFEMRHARWDSFQATFDASLSF